MLYSFVTVTSSKKQLRVCQETMLHRNDLINKRIIYFKWNIERKYVGRAQHNQGPTDNVTKERAHTVISEFRASVLMSRTVRW